MDTLEGRLNYNIQQLVISSFPGVDLQNFYFDVRISLNNRILIIVGTILPNEEVALAALFPHVISALNRMVRLNMLYVEGNFVTLQCCASDSVLHDPLLGIFRRHVRYLPGMDFGIDNNASILEAVNDIIQMYDDFRNGVVVGSGDMAIDDLGDIYPFFIISNIDLQPLADIMLVHYNPPIPFDDSSEIETTEEETVDTDEEHTSTEDNDDDTED